MHDFTEIDRMTMYEYCVRMKSHRLQQVDHEYMQAMKKQGRKRVPVYKNFSQFFDYDEKVEEAMTGKPVKCHGIGKRLMQAARMQKERRKKDGKL